MLCLDSDFLIFLTKGEKSVENRLHKLHNSGKELCTTTVNLMEVLHGASDKERRILTNVFQSLTILSFDWEAMLRTVKIRKQLSRAGRPIGLTDEMIAGTCTANHATIVTRNVKHFKNVKGLKVLSW